MKKKIVSLCLVAALALCVMVGGTVAYLTDTDSDVNVMTLGKLDIVQEEVVDTGKLVPGGDYFNKDIIIKNQGDVDVYFRTIYAFEDTRDISPAIHYYYSNFAEIDFPGGNGDWLQIKATIDGEETIYTVGYYEHRNALVANGELKIFDAIKLDPGADNEWYEIAGDSYEILVLTQAAQTSAGDSAKVALDTSFGEITASSDTQIAEWFLPVLQEEYPDAENIDVTAFNYSSYVDPMWSGTIQWN